MGKKLAEHKVTFISGLTSEDKWGRSYIASARFFTEAALAGRFGLD
jgi:hypothetical protein